MTIFERILTGEIPATIVYQDDLCFAIRDIDPQAPVHILIIPKQVIPRIAEASEADEAVLGRLLRVARLVAEQEQLANGYRIVINNGRDGGESVPHLHVHLLGGRAMHWPPG